VLVAATASKLGDSYCSLAWGEKLAHATDEATATAVIRGGDSGLSRRDAALSAWARKLVADPNSTTDADVEGLRLAGFTEREIFEATVWIGLRLGFSTINDALGLQPDAQLAERVPAAVREAVSFGRPAAAS
jgi:alkylhydroperoxidase family enzyme